jgi:predicted transglutaminase-like cysteine proteinase
LKDFDAPAEDHGFVGAWAATVPLPLRRPSALADNGKVERKFSGAGPDLASLPEAIDPKVERISFGTPTLAPMAFMRFCLRYSHDCAVSRRDSSLGAVDLTKERKAELVRVNREVNYAIRPKENTRGIAAEEWLVAPRSGDCNDYAVTKRHRLLALGWPSQSLLLAEVAIAAGEHHLILIVRTRQQDLVLDNLSQSVLPVSDITYRWVRAQEPKNPRFWAAISVAPGMRIAMNGD